ncbi:t116 [Tupaiid betaherpesvirus 1]|uniref:T116 n=1 Tax=Tupaiid herpesvirus 1 (strain 1) TaxID=10397 RepID=Q91TI5_TUHV1|nr:t116 [Tupaiid betaherpesvirus 1]AAK57162.1 t116 [Tupaiid betaherpesvirus 1]
MRGAEPSNRAALSRALYGLLWLCVAIRAENVSTGVSTPGAMPSQTTGLARRTSDPVSTVGTALSSAATLQTTAAPAVEAANATANAAANASTSTAATATVPATVSTTEHNTSTSTAPAAPPTPAPPAPGTTVAASSAAAAVSGTAAAVRTSEPTSRPNATTAGGNDSLATTVANSTAPPANGSATSAGAEETSSAPSPIANATDAGAERHPSPTAPGLALDRFVTETRDSLHHLIDRLNVSACPNHTVPAGFALAAFDNVTFTLTACGHGAVSCVRNETEQTLDRGGLSAVVLVLYKRLNLRDLVPNLVSEFEKYRYTLEDLI